MVTWRFCTWNLASPCPTPLFPSISDSELDESGSSGSLLGAPSHPWFYFLILPLVNPIYDPSGTRPTTWILNKIYEKAEPDRPNAQIGRSGSVCLVPVWFCIDLSFLFNLKLNWLSLRGRWRKTTKPVRWQSAWSLAMAEAISGVYVAMYTCNLT